MGYRSEKLIVRKKNKRDKKRKRFLIFLITLILIGGIYLVDKSYSKFESDNNLKVFAYQYDSNIHRLQLFGKKYYLKDDITANLIYNIKNKAKYLFENIKNYINE